MYDDWRGRLYPEREPKRRWLELYAQTFDTVEVNNTFYRLARESMVRGWVQQTPSEFLFAVKASRYLTHIKRLRGIEEGIKRFYEPLSPLIEAGRLGPVLWQLPENFHRDDERLEGWLALLPDGMHTIEFRHESWFVPEVMKRLRENGIALAIGQPEPGLGGQVVPQRSRHLPEFEFRHALTVAFEGNLDFGAKGPGRCQQQEDWKSQIRNTPAFQ